MGIQGLLQALKPYAEPVHVKKYAGKRVGIDAYSWLHKGAYACGMDLQLNDSRSEKRKVPLYVSYCMHRIRMLKYNSVIPVVVFDGGPLPLKASTQEERRRRRETNLENAQRKHADGDMLGAQELYQRAVEVTPAMAHELIEVLREEGVEFVVAPYEADAQLAYLACLPGQKGGIAAVISEDSDLLAYGCKAVLFKMDRYGHCEEICISKLFECDPPPLKALAFKGFTQDLFVCMCVMAGCDFLGSIRGIGVRRAHVLLTKYRNISRVLSKLKLERAATFPDNYMADFSQAKAIFSHARVYCREKRALVFLNPLPEELLEEFEGNLDFLGPDLPQSRAKAIAEGRLDPITMEAFNSISPLRTPVLTKAENEDVKKNTEFTLSPITPLSMYGSKKQSPKLLKPGSFLSPRDSKPASSPSTPFAMFTSKKGSLMIFESPSVKALENPGRNEFSGKTDLEVETTEIEYATCSLSEVARPPREMDDSLEASQVTISFEQRTSETQASVSRRTVSDGTEVDRTFLAELQTIAGCGREVPTQDSTTGIAQATSSGRGIVPHNPFKRKMVETSSESLHVSRSVYMRTSRQVQVDDDGTDMTSCGVAKEPNFKIRLRETSGDGIDGQIVSPELGSTSFHSLTNEVELASQIDSMFVQSGNGVDGSPSSVLTEISPNFEAAEDSTSDMIASARFSASSATAPMVVKNRFVRINRSTSTPQNDKSRGGRKSKGQPASPANPPGAGILRFFKPVSL